VIRRFAPLLALALLGFSPFRVEERHVRQGNERLLSGDPTAALKHYDEAEQRVGSRPEIDYDRGEALYRMGRKEEARKSWGRAAERAPSSLASRARQNQGTALAAAGDREGALAALAEALHLDPANEDARFDLEVLLRRKAAEEEKAAARGEEKPSTTAEKGQPTEPNQHAGEPQAAGEPAPAGGEASEPDAEDGKARAAGETPISRPEAERILDAFRAREEIMPPGPAGRRTAARRGDAERDW